MGSAFEKSVRNPGRADGPESQKLSEIDVRPQVWASNNAKFIAEGPGTSWKQSRHPKTSMEN